MNKFITIIITSLVAMVIGALKFVKGITQDQFNAAIDEIVLQLQAAKAEFNTEQTETVEQVVEEMVVNALTGVQAGLDSQGDTKYDNYFEEGEDYLGNLAKNPTHPIVAALKTAWQKLFHPKANTAS